MHRLWFTNYEDAQACAEKFHTTACKESLESVGLDNRNPGYYVDLTNAEYEEYTKEWKK